jgi:hypothetical protein
MKEASSWVPIFLCHFLEAIDDFDGEIEAIMNLPYANKTTNNFLLSSHESVLS